ncbi:STM3941 family protein [Crocinitomix catalasitica]|uniref:STM3941 family protein n=1 Tax=Crocinitomix catalasitica TaxID=184607 RepID=UPI0004830020|nr:STM3941 family protein [Crocinitomix catalasitica]
MTTATLVRINKNRVLRQIVIYISLGLLSIIGFFYIAETQDYFSPLIFKTIGFILFAIFGVVAGTFINQYRTENAGIQFDKNGISDLTSSISVGLIPWKSITGFTWLDDKTVLVLVKNPEVFIEEAKNGAIKKLLEQNLKLNKTPILINWGALEQYEGGFEAICTAYYSKYGKQKK